MAEPEGSGDLDLPELTNEQLLAAVQQRFAGTAISLVPPPADPALAWKIRAEEYEASHDQYKGPSHWIRCIAVLAATGSVPFACKQAGVSHGRFNRRQERYECFAEHVQQALAYFGSAVLERAATQRAVDGVAEPVFHKGIIVGHVLKYSDTLMNKLLEGNNPDKFKSRVAVEDSREMKIIVEGGLPQGKSDEEKALEADAAGEPMPDGS